MAEDRFTLDYWRKKFHVEEASDKEILELMKQCHIAFDHIQVYGSPELDKHESSDS